MSASLFDLFKELSISEQEEIREYMFFRRQRVAYIKNKIRELSPQEEERFAHLIASPVKLEDETLSSDFDSDEEEIISTHEEPSFPSKLDKPLADVPDFVYIGHCKLCTCHLNDDCACYRNHDHYFGDEEELNRDLNRISFINNMHRQGRDLPVSQVERVLLPTVPRRSPKVTYTLRLPQPDESVKMPYVQVSRRSYNDK